MPSAVEPSLDAEAVPSTAMSVTGFDGSNSGDAQVSDTSSVDGSDAVAVDDASVDADSSSADAADSHVEPDTDARPLSGRCGDGTMAPDEACDDGNTEEEHACPYGEATCSRCDATCSQVLSLTGPICGDGVLNDGEICDTRATWCEACRVVPAIAAGQNHTCVLLDTGEVKCWGYGDFGQLGNGELVGHSTAISVYGLGSSVSAIAAGGHHTCALLDTGAVQCWGYGRAGQLGQGGADTADHPTPVTVPGLSSVSAIAAGGSHTCALLTDGEVRCWGDGYYGQLGQGPADTADHYTPVIVSALGNASAIAAGYYHSCALLVTGFVQCWGYGLAGQLGQGEGDITDHSTPVTVSGLSDVFAITAGEHNSWALLTGGSVLGWGAGSSGQLGDGNATNQPTPVAVSNLNGAVSMIAGGNDHTCVLLTDATVWCWGRGDLGQLGDGNTTNQSTPVHVGGLTGVSAIAAGSHHTCALLTTGGARCWGRGDSGQLGNNTEAVGYQSSTPVSVVGIP